MLVGYYFFIRIHHIIKVTSLGIYGRYFMQVVCNITESRANHKQRVSIPGQSQNYERYSGHVTYIRLACQEVTLS